MLLNNRLMHARRSDFTTAKKLTKLRPSSVDRSFYFVFFVFPQQKLEQCLNSKNNANEFFKFSK